ncbi:MAG: hypothetical protein AAF630_09230 [Cyanobacteria bacterium P01_C01_bin.38]
MRKSKLIGLILGTSLVFGGLPIDSAKAQSNGSNITGTNLSNITRTKVFSSGPIFTRGGELNSGITQRAQQIAEELQKAYEKCSTCKPCVLRGFLIPNKPQTTPKQTSSSPKKCKQYKALLIESKNFLIEVNEEIEAVKTSIVNRTW